MKVTKEHLEHMRQAIAPLDTDARRAAYRAGAFPRAEACKDLHKRYRWDLAYAAGLSQWLCDAVYPYADDSHVDTALRSIVPTL